MTTIGLLVGLLLLAYFGGVLDRSETARPLGFAAGTAWVLLGVLLGPKALNLIELESVSLLQPVVEVALAWLALVIGLKFGVSGARRVSITSLLLGVFAGALTALAVATAVYWFLSGTTLFTPQAALVLALAAGAIGSGTTQDVVHWYRVNYHARGPVADTLAEMGAVSDIVPLLGLSIVVPYALMPQERLALLRLGEAGNVGDSLHFALLSNWAGSGVWGWALATLGLGALLGIISAVLLGKRLDAAQHWGIVLGCAWLGIGIAYRLALSPLCTLFFAGLTIAVLSPHRTELRQTVGQTERLVIMPTLFVSGVCLDFALGKSLWLTIALVVGTRFLSQWLLGLVCLAVSKRLRKAGLLFGFALSPAGALSLVIALSLALSFPEALGRQLATVVLFIGVACSLLGDLLGPVVVSRVLRRSGSIEPDQRRDPISLRPPAAEPGHAPESTEGAQ